MPPESDTQIAVRGGSTSATAASSAMGCHQGLTTSRIRPPMRQGSPEGAVVSIQEPPQWGHLSVRAKARQTSSGAAAISADSLTS